MLYYQLPLFQTEMNVLMGHMTAILVPIASTLQVRTTAPATSQDTDPSTIRVMVSFHFKQRCKKNYWLLPRHFVSTDIDECAEGSHECHVTTHCVNTGGSYNCICNQSGYSFKGNTCSGWLHFFFFFALQQ